ncbi:general secretion pathway protein C [Legionella lansingensis]|uniref:General secretion pathway protein C n=1 Tax=Legionella lansingensis TaxID=45067 RepID=A0A0W0VFK3_9GAMM|nr:type II secretion system protein N [Legionella lansingensis]KTD18582.1 general secretion pathway protein C [Legionella lansingensis]SNV49336.1 general secretion pathway protein C [Legionella lansingensis]
MMKNIKFFLEAQDSKLIAAVLIFLVACFLFLWEMVSFFRSQEIVTVTTKITSVRGRESLQSNSPLFTRPLFGAYVPTNLADAEIKQSMLDVEVVGILFSNKEENSQVIIRAGGGQEKIYMIGDTLPGGAVIKRISENGVVVLHNGVLESLSLPKNELLFDAPAKPLIEE